MLKTVLAAIEAALAHILQPLAGTALAALQPTEIALASVLVKRFIPDVEVQNLIISLLTNPNPQAHAQAIDKLDETSRAIAHLGTTMLPGGRDVADVPEKQQASAPVAAVAAVAPVPQRDASGF